MKNKTIIKILICLAVFALPLPGLALTQSEKQVLIAQIQQQINQLTLQLQQMIAQQGTGSWCYTFNSNLGYANYGGDVSRLHLALQKQGISYYPDDLNTYGSATTNAVKQFQTKYQINPTGYTGPQTRAKLNSLYACRPCTSNWQCSSWDTCYNSSQIRYCSDLNKCINPSNRPIETQNCTNQPAIKIQANNSDGPLNLFLPLGGGATLGSSQINLSATIYLNWTGVEVASCKASDTLANSLFSGYKLSSSGESVVLSGAIKTTASAGSKISDTFKIQCVSVKTGQTVSDSVTVNLFYNVTSNCNPSWNCTSWSNCSNNQQTRTCTDSSGCMSSSGKPVETQACSAPTVDIKANNSDGIVTVNNAYPVNLSWVSTNAVSCNALESWSGSKALNGAEEVMGTSFKTYTIICTGSSGNTAQDSVVVNFTP